MRIGAHCGPVLVGNLGSRDRLHYTCIGDNVNFASKLEGLNKVYGTEILISEDMYQHARLRYLCRPVDFITLKGHAEQALIYEPLGARERIRDQAVDAIRLYTKSFYLMSADHLKEAEAGFRAFLELVRDDKPAMRHLKFCQERLRQLDEREPQQHQKEFPN